MIEASLNRLEFLTEHIPKLLAALPEDELSASPAPGKWSKKEILGHLIDSATNNHQRFIRGQFEESPVIGYDQNLWNRFSFYRELDSSHLIAFWTVYNQHLAAILKRIPQENLEKTCTSTDGRVLPLSFLIVDYVSHLEHHLKQLVNY
ncbi:MAG TPA: DinB family protein [Flavipsychrobacter sp.]|nr:DinB family protein [Flavipsychrobacter sp.]